MAEWERLDYRDGRTVWRRKQVSTMANWESMGPKPIDTTAIAAKPVDGVSAMRPSSATGSGSDESFSL
ncbi:MAG: hypothetical protein ACYDDF_04185 [Thermoplasmatota archaeon]